MLNHLLLSQKTTCQDSSLEGLGRLHLRPSTHGNMLSKLWSRHSRCMFWFGEPRADWHGVFCFCFLLCFYFLVIFYINLQEATSLVAKAEVLQASIGVSCNEVDIQATTQDHNEVDVQATTQDHNEDASEDAHPENSSAVQDGAGIDGGVDAIDAEEVPCRHSVQAMPLSIDLLTSSVNGSLVWLKQRYKSFVMTHAVIPFWPAC